MRRTLLVWLLINIINVMAGKCTTEQIPHCYKCNPEDLNKCIQNGCEYGYHIANEDTECRPDGGEHCIEVKSGDSTKEKCEECEDGYYLKTDDELCAACDPSCATCEESATKCLSCDNSKSYLKANKCETGDIDNCVSYDQTKDNTCLQCKEGFRLDSAKANVKAEACVACTSGHDCKTCTEDNKCETCEAGKYLDSTDNYKCKACDTSCATCNDATTCATCPAGKYLDTDDNNKCKTPSPAISNCDYYASATECSKCAEGYHYKSDLTQCYKDVEYCTQYDTTNEDKCKTCADGYIINTENNKCEPCVEGCDKCELATRGTKCTTCNLAYYKTSEDLCNYLCYNTDSYCSKCDDNTEHNVKDLLNKCVSCEGGRTENEVSKCVESGSIMNGIIIAIIALITLL